MEDMQSIQADFGEGQTTVYFKRRNLDQMDRVLKAEGDGHVEVLVVTLLTRCLTEHGALMFSASDRNKIRKDFDPVEVLRVNRLIREYDTEHEQSMGK